MQLARVIGDVVATLKDESAVAARRAFARENTWMRRFEPFEAAIKDLLPRT